MRQHGWRGMQPNVASDGDAAYHGPRARSQSDLLHTRSPSSIRDEEEQHNLDEDVTVGLLRIDKVDAQAKSRGASTLAIILFALAIVILIILSFVLQQRSGRPSHAVPSALPQDVHAVLANAGQKALGGGLGGAVAGACQVLALMWLRTVMNYQYRHGGSLRNALSILYSQGGIGRFYQGVSFALVQTPLSRFGDTSANIGMLTLFALVAPAVPLSVRTACGSAAAAFWRLLITPLDTCKTTMQVEGKHAYELLLRKVHSDGVGILWNGAIANAVANFVGSYPWFLTFNMLDEVLPQPEHRAIAMRLLRSAFMGCVATGVSDVVSNSAR